MPQAIRPARFFADLEAYASLSGTKPGFTEFYGLFDAFPEFNLAPAPSLMVYVDGNPVPAEDVRCRNLSTWGQPAGSEIGIDVALGRLALGPGVCCRPPRCRSSIITVSPSTLGGGPYRRRAWLMQQMRSPSAVLTVDGSGAPGTFATIGAALAQWVADGGPDAIDPHPG